MKIIINALGYVGQSGGAGGAGVFLQYLISHLSQHCDVDVLVAPNAKHFRGSRGSKARFLELPYLPAETLRHLSAGPTVVLDPFGGLPCVGFPDDIALCVVVHDLMHLERPHFFTAAEREGRSHSFAAGFERADAVITFSADQARAIKQFFPGTSPVVIPHLPYQTLRDHGATGDAAALPDGLADFVLFPGVKWPHKNHRTVIEAFGSYVRQTGSALRLVMCGGACAESRFSFLPPDTEVSDQILDLGLVDNDTLNALFGAARAVLFPTLYEGFGIPVLEAAYLGKMVVASGLTVFDEILGAANYRRVEDPLCHLRWMEAFADIEGGARETYQQRSLAGRGGVDSEGFIQRFVQVLKAAAERYTHPALYPARQFPAGDRLSTTHAGSLGFNDLFGTALADRGSRNAVLGAKAGSAASTIFRSLNAAPDRPECLRALYKSEPPPGERAEDLQFSAWLRLQGGASIDALHWSVNDQSVRDLLPLLEGGEWRLFRAAVPASGFIDFRGVKGGKGEASGFDLEIHDPVLLRVARLTAPRETATGSRLTILVAALAADAALPAVLRAIDALNLAVPGLRAEAQWLVLSHTERLPEAISSAGMPGNLRLHLVPRLPFGRDDATAVISPYQPVNRLLLLEHGDLAAVGQSHNLKLLAAAIRPRSAPTAIMLALEPGAREFWRPGERGVVLEVAHRIGQPIPLLDPQVIASCLAQKPSAPPPRFAVIETDRTSRISHHGVVSGLFLEGAKALGYQPVLGLNAAAASDEDDDVDVWGGFSAQVYQVGSAAVFTEELTQFVAAEGLGPADVIFMHSLSPQILLGAARFVAACGAASPRFVMRFFSTAEAMGGHKLSYVKILKSIEAVRVVRHKMHFFCESNNLREYYQRETGCRYPLLFNPEHPSLAIVRASQWYDPNLGGGARPILAYFGEAREEKGFDDLPGIVASLLEAPALAAFQFMIQTGSNGNNDTAKIQRAKSLLTALRAKFPDRMRLFESAETPEQFYFLMKHAKGVIAPYRPQSYGTRGTGVTLEALQLGLDVFAWANTDLYATFAATGRVIGVAHGASFADAIVSHYSTGEPRAPAETELPLSLTPAETCERMLSLCVRDGEMEILPAPLAPVFWVGNDTLGEGCSAVYSAQKQALRAQGRDCFELFVPWPDPPCDPNERDGKIYGFGSLYESCGLAWVASPGNATALEDILRKIYQNGPTYQRLRALNQHFSIAASLRQAITRNNVTSTILNYAHLYPVIADMVPLAGVVCEMHDVMAYAHAVRRGSQVLLTEKIDEFSDLARFAKIVAISADEQREVAGACSHTQVAWRLPPYLAEAEPILPLPASGAADIAALEALGGIPDDVAAPSLLMLNSYFLRDDLSAIFRIGTKAGRAGFFRWWFFFGQREAANGFGLTRRQYEWVMQPTGDGEAPAMSGLLRLYLSMREDLRRAFIRHDGIDVASIDVAGFTDWADQHAAAEFGISAQLLARHAEREFAAGEEIPLAGANAALRAVLDAGTKALAPEAAKALFERIAEVPQIDMALVGSGHPANVESFRWFLREIFVPYFAPKGRNLFIAGSVCEQLREFSHRNLFLLGRCDRIEPILAASQVCPLPIVAGSGTPIKAIPALAANGAVTVTPHIDRAFGLAGYGIPSFSEPREFAGDVWRLLDDAAWRAERQACARRYAADSLSFEGYVAFWQRELTG